MKSFLTFNKGRTPRQAHVDLDGLKEDELGRDGFAGRAAQLYRRNDPTKYRATGDYRPRNLNAADIEPPDLTDPAALPLPLLENADCRISLSRRSAEMPFYLRNVRGDEFYFVHTGTGTLETEFGSLAYEPGDYLVIPKATTYRFVPSGDEALFMVCETAGELEVQDFGVFGRHAPFDPALLDVPEPQAFEDEDGAQYEVRIVHASGVDSIFYPNHPCDVVGWKGDLFPFRFNIRDWRVIMSDSIHLPPTVHQFLGAPGVCVCHFLPRPAEGIRGVERVPWYHRNADYDEVVLYHAGTFMGHELPYGMISHAPQGLHHGAPEEVREFARANHDEIDRVDWKLIAIDTRKTLHPTRELRELEAASKKG